MTLMHANIPLRNVMVAEGLRVHICPKVATASISAAMHGSGYHHESPLADGDEYRWMCIRHPLDRLVSCWAFFCNSDTDHEIKGQHDIIELGYYHKMPFDEFLDIALEKHELNAHTRKQARYAGGKKFDRLCLLEELPEEWKMLQARFHFLTKELPLTHKSDHRHWSEYYTPEQRKRAEAVFSEDMELFEHERVF